MVTDRATTNRITRLVGLLALLGSACADRALVGRLGEADSVDASLPMPGTFDGPANPDPEAQPLVVYPLDGAVLGPNVPGMNVQWRLGDDQSLFRLRVVGAGGKTFTFFGEASGCPDRKCRLPIPDRDWAAVGEAFSGAEAQLFVDAVGTAGGPVATSAPVNLRFAASPLPGDMYYFAVPGPGYSGGTIQRASLTDRVSREFLSAKNTKSTKGFCVGCHAVSPDGCKVSANFFDPATITATKLAPDRTLLVVPSSDPNRPLTRDTGAAAAYQAFSPDGQRLLTVVKGQMTLRDGSGNKVADVRKELVGKDPNNVVSHIDWSPDGKSIVLTRLNEGAPYVDDPDHAGDLLIMPYNDGKFGTARLLLAASKDEFHYYPTFSPDGRWIVFTSGRLPGHSPTMDGHPVPPGYFSPYDQQTSRLRIISVDGGKPIELANATHGKDVAASWARFLRVPVGSFWFLVFSSKIDYGWVVEQADLMTEDRRYLGRPQLWAAALDPARLGAGADPSFAPFWLPFQRPELRNHLGVWTSQHASDLKCP